MKKWSYLSPGDIVDIIAPASPCPKENLEEGINWLVANNFIPQVPEDIIKGDVYFAAPLKDQLEMMKAAVYSESKMLWSLRGGYGSMRLIPHMNKWKKPKKTKIFMGFSDVTALHIFFNQSWGWPTIHGRNLSAMSVEKKSKDRNETLSILTGKKEELIFKGLRPMNLHARNAKTIRGEIIGGNLNLIQTSIGTSWQLKSSGKILFFEDVGERGYAIDRMFEQLRQAKVLNQKVNAVILGDFTEAKEKSGKDLSPEALKRFAELSPFPVFKGLKCGHGETNFSLPFGAPAHISKNILKVESGGH